MEAAQKQKQFEEDKNHLSDEIMNDEK